MTQTVEARISQFVTLLQALYDDYFAKHYSNLTSPVIARQEGGIKYARITVLQRYTKDGVTTVSDSGSVYCFIDLKNGDIYKAAGWKAPAKGARGNIFNDNCDVGTRADMNGSGLYRR
jgi:hypothetical protein